MKLPLRGIIPPVVTPLLSEDEIDTQGLASLVDHLILGGVHGLFLLGTTGEASSLGYRLKEELVRTACRLVGKRIPVVAGITDSSPGASVEMAWCYKEAGVDAVVIAPPYYVPISQEEMVHYLSGIVPKLPLPFMMYNIPSHTKLHMSEETVDAAREMGAIGIKDSSGDLFYLYSLIGKFKAYPEFAVIAGTEMFIPETMLFGGHGAIAGGANIFPALFVDLYEASLSGNLERIRILRQIVMEIYKTIYSVGVNASKYTLGIKSSLEVLQICSGYVASPMRIFSGEERERIRISVEWVNRMYNNFLTFGKIEME
jgi:4-hydroxy-tetrahydrodipicolinate synthase